MKPNIIAIDGPAASGKSTLGELLAKHLSFLFFDTGVMYRAVTLAALRKYNRVDDEGEVSTLAEQIVIDIVPPTKNDGRKFDVLLNGEDVTHLIRLPEIDANVSVVSSYKGVRKAMTQQQRKIGLRGNVVMVGRDIGTVVLPEADLKIYLDASVEERARRRYKELIEAGRKVDKAEITNSIIKRDKIDSSRDIAPLRPALDAVIINSDGMDIDQVYKKVAELL